MRDNLLKLAAIVFSSLVAHVWADTAQNPIIHADVPDMAMIRVGDTYYMSSTTMHMSPGQWDGDSRTVKGSAASCPHFLHQYAE